MVRDRGKMWGVRLHAAARANPGETAMEIARETVLRIDGKN